MYPCLLIVLDGWGWREETRHNAVLAANPRQVYGLLKRYPTTLLAASGLAVGLPEGFIGNSEVGHLHIGAGRTVSQLLTQISTDIKSGAFFQNPVIREALRCTRENGAALHLMGLLSDGGVHSHQAHLEALLRAAREAGCRRVAVHAFLDGRDTPPESGVGYVERLLSFMNETGVGALSTLMGRFYAMDRDNRWDRTRTAFEALVKGEGHGTHDPLDALRACYRDGMTDEFVKPHIVGSPKENRVGEGDAVVFFNFRGDRARQLTRAFTEKDFKEFTPDGRPGLGHFACMSEYDKRFTLPAAYSKQKLAGIFGETLSRHRIPQFRVAETEKYAHVTYFLNGGEEQTYAGEERILVPSNRAVKSYAEAPEMSARGIAREASQRLEQGPKKQVILVNFANPDMVGHTGDFEAARRACEVVDGYVGELVERVLALGGSAFVTADHGNAERMVDENGAPHTAHTTSLVPFVAVTPKGKKFSLRDGGTLANVAPTLFELLEIPPPPEMAAPSLVEAP
jgi:2,3-bisphosphoglycerate-independent phosphoglycerate mutase